MLLDSQDMDYNVKLQKDKKDCDCRKTITIAGAYCNETQLRSCWETWKKIVKFLDFFSFLKKSVSVLVCIGNFQEDGGNKLPSQEYSAHAWPIWDIPKGTKKIIHGDIFQQLHVNQREEVTSNIQTTYFVRTQRWF
jgi:hypothetical protein